VRNGDRIRIDIPEPPHQRAGVGGGTGTTPGRAGQAKGWKPAQPRPRKVSAALKAYALLAMSADKGAVRDLSLLGD
jgi:dihydroxy-acid dehydratase